MVCDHIVIAGLSTAPLPSNVELLPGTVDLVLCRNPIDGHGLRPDLLLSAWEQRRLERIVHAATRQRRMVGRALLRSILGRYCGLAPAQLRFTYGMRGKPGLAADNDCATRPYFNVSHSDEWMLCALCADRELGLDLEGMRPVSDIATLAGLACTPAEQRRLMALSDDRRPDALFSCWTRKEALIKLYGGAILPLAGDCPVSISNACRRRRYRPPAILTALVDLGEHLMIHDLQLLDGFRAALCYPIDGSTPALKLRIWTFPQFEI